MGAYLTPGDFDKATCGNANFYEVTAIKAPNLLSTAQPGDQLEMEVTNNKSLIGWVPVEIVQANDSKGEAYSVKILKSDIAKDLNLVSAVGPVPQDELRVPQEIAAEVAEIPNVFFEFTS